MTDKEIIKETENYTKELERLLEENGKIYKKGNHATVDEFNTVLENGKRIDEIYEKRMTNIPKLNEIEKAIKIEYGLKKDDDDNEEPDYEYEQDDPITDEETYKIILETYKKNLADLIDENKNDYKEVNVSNIERLRELINKKSDKEKSEKFVPVIKYWFESVLKVIKQERKNNDIVNNLNLDTFFKAMEKDSNCNDNFEIKEYITFYEDFQRFKEIKELVSNNEKQKDSELNSFLEHLCLHYEVFMERYARCITQNKNKGGKSKRRRYRKQKQNQSSKKKKRGKKTRRKRKKSTK